MKFSILPRMTAKRHLQYNKKINLSIFNTENPHTSTPIREIHRNQTHHRSPGTKANTITPERNIMHSFSQSHSGRQTSLTAVGVENQWLARYGRFEFNRVWNLNLERIKGWSSVDAPWINNRRVPNKFRDGLYCIREIHRLSVLAGIVKVAFENPFSISKNFLLFRFCFGMFEVSYYWWIYIFFNKYRNV